MQRFTTTTNNCNIFDIDAYMLFNLQNYKDFLKRQKILDVFLRNVEINAVASC